MNTPISSMSAAEFYRLRDERTSLMVGDDIRALSRLTLSIGDEEANTFNGQLCFLLLVSLSARWCRHLGVQAPNAQLHPDIGIMFGSTSLVDASYAIAKMADPFGLFQTSAMSDSTSHIHVGLKTITGAYTVMGSGWVAAAGDGIDFGSDAENTNPMGPALAAVVGACRSLRESLRHTDLTESLRLSLWDYSSGTEANVGPALQPFDLGRMLIVGTGAVGSSIAFLLPLLPVTIEKVHLIDADSVELPNLNRSLLFTAKDLNALKVETVTRHLKKFGINVSSTPTWYSGASPNLGEYDLVVPGANEYGVQYEMMNNYPPLMIGASTGTQWDIHLQRHIPIIDDCLECRIPSEKPKSILRCGTGDVSNLVDPGAPRQTGALPFLSFSASLLALSEIAKLGIPAYSMPKENGAIMLFKVPEPSFMTVRYDRKTNCHYCLDKQRFQRLRANSKFYSLSETGE